MTIISRSASPTGSQRFMITLMSALPVSSASSGLSLMLSDLSIFSYSSVSLFITVWNIFWIGSKTNWVNPRLQPGPAEVVHFFSAALKNWSPQRRFIILVSSMPNFLA
eukprot:Amastigsp_a676327_4345.p4 type:complete len:108 gc:universal Amastigsp_a676327_4345:1578-1901(+)